jgi:malate dehydrogenase
VLHKENDPLIGIVGSGRIGSALAYGIVQKKLGKVFLYDKKYGNALGHALDNDQALLIDGSTDFPFIKAVQTLEELQNTDIVVITAGRPRQPGETREQLLASNAQVIIEIASSLSLKPQTIVIVVTNPVDIMTTLFLHQSRHDPKKVLGMAGVLDTGRFLGALSACLNVPSCALNTSVIGAHSPLMVPLLSHTSIQENGLSVKILEWIGQKGIAKDLLLQACHEARHAGTQIVEAFAGSGSAYQGPACAIAQMIHQIIKGPKEKILTCSVMAQGHYGLEKLCIGLPCVLTKNGAEIIEWDITAEEKDGLLEGAQDIEKSLKGLGIV